MGNKHLQDCTFVKDLHDFISEASSTMHFNEEDEMLKDISGAKLKFKFCPNCGCALDDYIIETRKKLAYLEERIKYFRNQNRISDFHESIEEYRKLANSIRFNFDSELLNCKKHN
jgi:hypothetical protein